MRKKHLLKSIAFALLLVGGLGIGKRIIGPPIMSIKPEIGPPIMCKNTREIGPPIMSIKPEIGPPIMKVQPIIGPPIMAMSDVENKNI